MAMKLALVFTTFGVLLEVGTIQMNSIELPNIFPEAWLWCPRVVVHFRALFRVSHSVDRFQSGLTGFGYGRMIWRTT